MVTRFPSVSRARSCSLNAPARATRPSRSMISRLARAEDAAVGARCREAMPKDVYELLSSSIADQIGLPIKTAVIGR